MDQFMKDMIKVQHFSKDKDLVNRVIDLLPHFTPEQGRALIMIVENAFLKGIKSVS